MKKEYDFSKMKARKNPHAKSLWEDIFKETASIVKRAGLTEKDVAEAIKDYREKLRKH